MNKTTMNNNSDTNHKIILDLQNKSDSILLIGESSVKVEILIKKMIHAFSNDGFNRLMSLMSGIANLWYGGSEWFNGEVSCQLLEAEKNWKKGKVKINITLEFIPDELETENKNNDSVLDDIRQSIN